MFGIDSGEILIIAVVALVVIGPKDLPRAMRAIGSFIGRARGMARHFRSGLDTMMREAELEEMEKKWKEANERIMRDHPAAAPDTDWGKPAPEAPAPAKPTAPPAAPAASPPSRTAPPIPPAPASRDDVP